MFLSDLSVRRPVVALVLCLLLVVFGLVSFFRLAVREMPDVDSPAVSIGTTYEGASADIVESQITKPLEDEFSGISGIKNITSTSRTGRSRITVEFQLGWNMVEAVSDVRDAVSRARRGLPDAADEPVVTRDNGEGEVAIWLNLSSQQMDRTALTDYANRVLLDRLSLVNGVSSVSLSGDLTRVMYVRLDPEAMAGRGITVQQVLAALANENVQLPGGEVRNDSMVMAVNIDRLYQTANDFAHLQVATTAAGKAVYLGDIAQIRDAAKNEQSAYKHNGVVSVGIGITPQSTANPLAMAQGVIAEVARLQRYLPEGAKLEVDYNSTVFIEQAIHEVYSSLGMTALLVIAVLYLFIGQWRSTLIPALTVPVSLIAACIGAWYLGFSINLITLLALILAIGLVVDDSIVVVENIHHHLQQGRPPLLAAWHGCREVGFAVIATTVVLVMVFIPIAFMQGMIGRLFTEFALLLSLAVICSALVALTLGPALGSSLLRRHQGERGMERLNHAVLGWLEQGYRRLLKRMLSHAGWTPLLLLLCVGAIGLLYSRIPASLTPSEDRGVVYVFVRGAEGTSIERMKRNMEQVEQRLLPMVGKGVVKAISFSTPAFGRGTDQTGMLIVQLTDWSKRSVTAQQLTRQLNQRLADLPDISLRAFQPGFHGRSQSAVQFVLQGSDYASLFDWARKLEAEAKASGLMLSPELDYTENTPQLQVKVDRSRAEALGISLADIGETLQTLLGGSSRGTFVDRGEEYDVYVRADEQQFVNGGDLDRLYLRAAGGDMVSLASVAQVAQVAGPQRLSHNQRQRAITLSADVAPGHTLGEALDHLEQWAAAKLPPDITTDYAGESKDYRESQSDTLLVFLLALLVAYLVLAAQFESFVNPLVVMLTVPLGVLGGLAGLWLSGLSLNLYSQIGMIMLIGMVTKNGILIVEFANQLRDRGEPFEQAILDAAARRLRPILMTAATTLMGAVPLMLASGAGYESRIAVGTVVFFGMACSTLVSLFLVPASYRLLASRTQAPEHRGRLVQALLSRETKKSRPQSPAEEGGPRDEVVD